LSKNALKYKIWAKNQPLWGNLKPELKLWASISLLEICSCFSKNCGSLPATLQTHETAALLQQIKSHNTFHRTSQICW